MKKVHIKRNKAIGIITVSSVITTVVMIVTILLNDMIIALSCAAFALFQMLAIHGVKR